jgi:autotransporter adhesin
VWVNHEYFVCPADRLVWTPVLLKNNADFGTTGMSMCHAQYSFANDGGAIATIIPLNNCTIPINSIVYNASIQATTAATSGGSATVAVGLNGIGSGTAVLLGATAVASVTGQLQSAIVPQTASGWKKMTSAGNVTITVAVAALTAGIIEVYVFFLTSST